MRGAVPYPSQQLAVLHGELLRVGHTTIEAPGGPEPFYTVADGYYVRILAHHYVMDTNAGVGIRDNGYQIVDQDGTTIYEAYVVGNAGQNSQPVLSSGYNSTWLEPNNSANTLGIPIPRFWLWPGCQIRAHTLGLTGTESYDIWFLTLERITRHQLMRQYERSHHRKLRSAR